jgi:hypothetical protein
MQRIFKRFKDLLDVPKDNGNPLIKIGQQGGISIGKDAPNLWMRLESVNPFQAIYDVSKGDQPYAEFVIAIFSDPSWENDYVYESKNYSTNSYSSDIESNRWAISKLLNNYYMCETWRYNYNIVMHLDPGASYLDGRGYPAIAYIFDTVAKLHNSDSQLLIVRNGGEERFRRKDSGLTKMVAFLQQAMSK